MELAVAWGVGEADHVEQCDRRLSRARQPFISVRP